MRDYEILHLKPGASLAEIQQAYRDLVKVWHPDRFSSDPRLQEIANEKLKEINDAYLALEKAVQEPSRAAASSAPGITQVRPQHTVRTSDQPTARNHGFAWLWLSLTCILVALGAIRVYVFFEGPMRALDSINADARRLASRNGPSLVDAFAGWKGVLPQGLDRLVGFYQYTPAPGQRHVEISRLPLRPASPVRFTAKASPSSAFLPGVGEIQVHNRTLEEMSLTLRARVSATARRGIAAPAQGDIVLDNLGPDLYTLEVSFPHSPRAPIRLGPFVMVEIERASGRSGDRYEITLKP